MSEQPATPTNIFHVGERTMGAGTLIAIILGAILAGGAGAGVGVHRIHVKAQEAAAAAHPAVDTTAQGQATAVEQLTDLDLVEPLCEPQWLDVDPDGWKRLLCREALCWAQAQSTTTAAETTTCGSISNLADSVAIVELCAGAVESPECKAILAVVNARK